jgi:hypothetical protein
MGEDKAKDGIMIISFAVTSLIKYGYTAVTHLTQRRAGRPQIMLKYLELESTKVYTN